MSAADDSTPTPSERPRSARAILDWLHRIREQSWQDRQRMGDEAWLKQINRPHGYEEHLKRKQAQRGE